MNEDERTTLLQALHTRLMRMREAARRHPDRARKHAPGVGMQLEPDVRKKEKDGTAAPCPKACVTLKLKESGVPRCTEVPYPAGELLSFDTLYIPTRDMVSVTPPQSAKYGCQPILNPAILYLVVSEAPGMTPEMFLAAMCAAGVTRYTVDRHLLRLRWMLTPAAAGTFCSPAFSGRCDITQLFTRFHQGIPALLSFFCYPALPKGLLFPEENMSQVYDNAVRAIRLPDYPVSVRPVDYILSSCGLASAGLSALLENDARQTVEVRVTDGAPVMPACGEAGDRVVVYLPDDPQQVLLTLKSLVMLFPPDRPPVSVLILSHLHPEWLYRTLKHLVPGTKLCEAAHLLPADHDRLSLSRVLQGDFTASPYLSQLVARIRYQGGGCRGGLCPRELDVVLSALQGERVRALAQKLHLSVKTLYNYHKTGLEKMASQFPFIRPRLARYSGTTKNHTGLHPAEADFIAALHQDGGVFPVFQPVIRADMTVSGFEILSRWRYRGRVLMPAVFLPLICHPASWILLTAFVMKVAVAHINQWRGQYWFSVNIPAGLAGNPTLLQMAEVAGANLEDSAWRRRLVLEFSEKTDLSAGAGGRENLRQLRTRGFSVFLDDCFSASLRVMPDSTVRFSGYKLDMSVVRALPEDANARAQVRALLNRSREQGAECVAEGVESREIMQALTAMGMTGLQGYYLSPPVPAGEVGTVLNRLISEEVSASSHCRL